MTTRNIYMFVFCSFFFSFVLANAKVAVTYMEPSVPIIRTTSKPPGYFGSDLQIYCYKGSPKLLSHIFQSIYFELTLDNDDFVLYEGCTPEIVKTHYDNQHSIFSWNFLNARKKKLVNVNPFNQTCVGIETAHGYKLQLNLLRIDFWRIIMATTGLILFFTANHLCETPLFFYITGVLIGIFASMLVVVYFVAKLLPQKPMMYAFIGGGWTLGIYFTRLLWDNIQIILFNYITYVFWYIVITGFISFIICYRWGAPTNRRSKNLIKWGLQFGSIALTYFSSDFQEASVGIVILKISIYYFPTHWLNIVKRYWLRKFPPKRRLLTNEEYYEQTARETTKALEELRSFCSSPESKPWETMTKLKDPQRFAAFMTGQPHLMDSEILEYETLSRVDISDISDDSDDVDNNIQPATSRTHRDNVLGKHASLIYTSTPTTNGHHLAKRKEQVAEFSEEDD